MMMMMFVRMKTGASPATYRVRNPLDALQVLDLMSSLVFDPIPLSIGSLNHRWWRSQIRSISKSLISKA